MPSSMADGIYTRTDEIQASTEFTRFEHVLVGSLYMVFCVAGIITNLLSALVFYKDTKLLGSSKPWIHIFLAIANIGVVAPSPLPASSSFSGRWLYGNTMCQIYAFEGMLLGMTAIGAVIALCIERYAVGSKPNSRHKSGWFYTWSILLVLGNALFWATMPLLGWNRYAIELTGTSCALDWKNPDESYASYMITLQVFSFGIPLLAACVCLYSAHSQPSNRPSTPSTSSQEERPSQPSTAAGQAEMPGFTEDQLKSLCYVFILLVLVGWGPFAFLCMSAMIGDPRGVSNLGACIPPLACKFGVCAYPVAYAIASPRYRQSFSAMLGGGDKKED